MKQILLLCFLLNALNFWAQEPLKVYFSTVNFPTDYTATNFLRAEMQELAFVRDRKLCDVQVLEIEELAGLDARRVQLIFVGYAQFKGQNDTLLYFVNPAENQFSVREKRLEVLKEGLLPYLLQTEWSDALSFSPKEKSGSRFGTWGARLFGISADGTYSNSNSQIILNELPLDSTRIKNSSFNIRLSGAKVTQRRRFGGNVRYQRNASSNRRIAIVSPAGTTTTFLTESNNQSASYQSFWAEGIGKHLSLGAQLNGSWASQDAEHRSYLTLGAEYSFFPYSEWFERHFVLRYGLGKRLLGPTNNRLYASDKLDHTLSLFYQKRKQWGFLSARLSGNTAFVETYWNAWELRASTSVDLEIGRGFFFTTTAVATHSNRNYGRYRDAPVYSKAYRYQHIQAVFGLTYIFGTPWRTQVNPRSDEIFSFANFSNF